MNANLINIATIRIAIRVKTVNNSNKKMDM